MTMLGNAPDLYPTPLLEGFSDGSDETEDDILEVTHVSPSPLVSGFERMDSVRSPFYPGPVSVSPSPLVRGLRRPGDFSAALYGAYPTPQVSGFYTAPLTRTVFYKEQDAAGTHNASTSVYTDQMSYTIAGASLENATWLVLGSCCGHMDHSALALDARLRHDTAGVNFNEFEGEPGDLLTDTPLSFGGVVTFGAAPGDQTFSIETKAVSGLDSWSIFNRIMLIKLEAEDAYVYDATALNTTTSSSTWTTMASVNVPVDGDYDFFAFGTLREPTNGLNDTQFELLNNDGSRDKFVQASGHNSTTKKNPLMFHSQRLGMLAGQNALLRAKIAGGTLAREFTYRGVVALNRSRWAQVGYANDPSTRTPAGTSYADRNAASTLTSTLLDRETIVFGNATQYLQTGSFIPWLKLLIGSTTVGEGGKIGGNIAGGDRPFVFFKKLSPGAGSATMKWQTKETGSGSSHGDYKFADVGYWQI